MVKEKKSSVFVIMLVAATIFFVGAIAYAFFFLALNQTEVKQRMDVDKKVDKVVDYTKRTFNIDNITAIVKADLSIAEVSAASILAKVSRDRYMQKKSLEYPNYQFDKHKGYITKLHKELALKYGLSNLHRQSYKVKGFE